MYNKKAILEDGLLAIVIVFVFGTVFSITHAFQNETKTTPTVQILSDTSVVPKNPPQQDTVHTVAISSNARSTNRETPQQETQTATMLPTVKETDTTPVEIVPEPKSENVATVKTPIVVAESPKEQKSEVTTSQAQSEYAQKLVSLIETRTNAFRKKNGLSAFVTDSELAKNSLTYSKLMLRDDFFSHTDEDGCDMTCRFKKNGYTAQAWGENLAMMTFDDRPSVEEVADFFMKGWEKSAGHRENLLSESFTRQGIGIAMNAGAIYVTVDFAKP